ncbi:unnamed protein product [Gadus morhua 'NCC']
MKESWQERVLVQPRRKRSALQPLPSLSQRELAGPSAQAPPLRHCRSSQGPWNPQLTLQGRQHRQGRGGEKGGREEEREKTQVAAADASCTCSVTGNRECHVKQGTNDTRDQ